MTSQPLNSAPPQGPVEGRGVAEIRALCDAATPGPWSFYLGDLWAGATADELATADRLSAEHVFSDEAEDIFERASHLFHGYPVRPEDAQFIAAARDLVPSLLAEVEAAYRFEQQTTRESAEVYENVTRLVESLERVTEERDAFRDERNIAVNAAASKIPGFDVETIAVQVRQREAADSRARELRDERDSLRGVVQAVAQLHRRIVLSNGVEVDYCACGKRNCSTVAALAAAADAPQPEGERCSATHQRYGRCDLRAGHDDRHRSDIGADGPEDPGYTWTVHGSVAFRNGPRIPS